jgi:hypothetical protein
MAPQRLEKNESAPGNVGPRNPRTYKIWYAGARLIVRDSGSGAARTTKLQSCKKGIQPRCFLVIFSQLDSRRHFPATPSASRAAISRRPKRLGSKDRRSTRRSPPAAAQERLQSPPNRNFPNCVLHAGLETPRPPGEDRGRLKSSKNHHSTDHVFQKGKSTQENRRGKVDAVHSAENRARGRARPASDHLPPSSGQPSAVLRGFRHCRPRGSASTWFSLRPIRTHPAPEGLHDRDERPFNRHRSPAN